MFPISQYQHNPKLISAFGQALVLPLSVGVCVAERDPAQESQISAALSSQKWHLNALREIAST